MDDYQLLVDLHRDGDRQGPGGAPETLRAIDLAGLDRLQPWKIADVGCGTGASAVLLAQHLNAQITAVDFLPEFLAPVEARARNLGVANRITTLACSMDALPFAEHELDVIWSEGAIYNIGFERGVDQWRQFLKPNGLLVVSEITWLTNQRPAEIDTHWRAEYPEIDLASAKLRVLENRGFSPIGYFVLPEHCWLDNYYRPLEARFADFLQRHDNSPEARQIVLNERREIDLYQAYKSFFGYGMYIAKKVV